MYLLHLTFISSISHFHIFYKHIPHKIPIHTLHISKLHVSHSIRIQDPCPTKYLHIIPIHITNTISHQIYLLLTISTHLKTYQTLFQEHITKAFFSWKTYIYNAKSPSYERQKLIKFKTLLMEGNITHTWLKTKRALHGENHLSAR